MRRVAGWVLVIAVVGRVAPLIAPYAPDALDLANRRAAPSLAHWFGTDDLGRDMFSRALFGGRVSIAIGLLSALVSGGLPSARFAGLLPTWCYGAGMRQSVPTITLMSYALSGSALMMVVTPNMRFSQPTVYGLPV